MEGKHLTFESCWELIKTNALNKLEACLQSADPAFSFSTKEYSLLYTTVYNLCTDHNMEYSGLVYQKYCECVSQYLQKHAAPVVQPLHGVSLLTALANHWSNHKFMLRWLNKFFQYLDRFYVKSQDVPTLTEKGLELFKAIAFNPVKKRVTKAVLDEINKSREGEFIDDGLLKGAIEIFIETGKGKKKAMLYDEDFEAAYLEDVTNYFRKKAAEWLGFSTLGDYVRKAYECIKAEEDRISKYMHVKTKKKMKAIFNEEVLIRNAGTVLQKEKGLGYLLRNNSLEDLKKLYTLYAEIPDGMNFIAPAFKVQLKSETDIIYQEVVKTIASESGKSQIAKEIVYRTGFIEKLLAVLRKYNGLIAQCFASNGDIKAAYNSALSSVLNKELPGVIHFFFLLSKADSRINVPNKKLRQQFQTYYVHL